jgi:hypothetical protein
MPAEELGIHCGSDITFTVNSDFKGLGILESDRLVSSFRFWEEVSNVCGFLSSSKQLFGRAGAQVVLVL